MFSAWTVLECFWALLHVLERKMYNSIAWWRGTKHEFSKNLYQTSTEKTPNVSKSKQSSKKVLAESVVWLIDFLDMALASHGVGAL